MRVSHLLILCVATLTLLFAGCRDKTASPVLARVNDQPILLQAFLQEFDASLRNQDPISPAQRLDLQRKFMATLVDRMVLEQEAAQRGITLSEGEIDAALDEIRGQYPEGEFAQRLAAEGVTLAQWRQGLAQRLLSQKLLREVVAGRAVVSDEEVAAYYEENLVEFAHPAQVRARQIVVATEDEARQALARLRQGEDFAVVARDVSLSPDSADGGDLGWFGRGEMPPEFDAVVFSLRPGRTSEVVQTPYGWHLFRLEERRRAAQQSLEEVADMIRQRLVAQREDSIYQAWLSDVRARAVIDIDWSLLARQEKDKG